ncbi:hypothetical protein IFM89_014517, partial [Coptis chinensis]
MVGKKLNWSASYPDLPHEIVFFGILNRLPLKSLVRFSCVHGLHFGNNSWKDMTVGSNLSKWLSSGYLRVSKSLWGVLNSDRALCSNCALNWFFRDAYMLMSFDIHNEKFSMVR